LGIVSIKTTNFF
jgi:serine/threonine protein kinase